MKITEVCIKRIRPQNGMIAFAKVTLDNVLQLEGIGVHRKLDRSGYRLTYPNKRAGGGIMTLFYPIDREFGRLLEKEILSELAAVLMLS